MCVLISGMFCTPWRPTILRAVIYCENIVEREWKMNTLIVSASSHGGSSMHCQISDCYLIENNFFCCLVFTSMKLCTRWGCFDRSAPQGRWWLIVLNSLVGLSWLIILCQSKSNCKSSPLYSLPCDLPLSAPTNPLHYVALNVARYRHKLHLELVCT